MESLYFYESVTNVVKYDQRQQHLNILHIKKLASHKWWSQPVHRFNGVITVAYCSLHHVLTATYRTGIAVHLLQFLYIIHLIVIIFLGQSQQLAIRTLKFRKVTNFSKKLTQVKVHLNNVSDSNVTQRSHSAACNTWSTFCTLKWVKVWKC